MQHLSFKGILYLGEVVSSNEGMGSMCYDRTYSLYSYNKLKELSEKGWISKSDFKTAFSYNLDVRGVTTLPFDDFPSDVPPLKIEEREQYKITAAEEKTKTVKEWSF